MKDIVILDGARTPMAEYNGHFTEISAIDLGVIAAKEALRRSESYLAEACKGDDELREQVDSLLRAHGVHLTIKRDRASLFIVVKHIRARRRR